MNYNDYLLYYGIEALSVTIAFVLAVLELIVWHDMHVGDEKSVASLRNVQTTLLVIFTVTLVLHKLIGNGLPHHFG